MQSASYLPDDLQLYLALVGLLRERGMACASMQVDCQPQRDAQQPALKVTGTPHAKSLLSGRLERELGRSFDPRDDAWRLSLDEAWKMIDCCALL